MRPNQPINFGIMCAVDEEFNALTSKISAKKFSKLGDKNLVIGDYNGLNVAIVQSGIGNINSAMATAALIAHYDPDMLLFSGIAGSLNPDLNVGDVLVGKSSFQAEAISHEQLRVTWDMPELDKPADSKLLSIAESLYEKCSYPVRTGIIVSSDIYPAPKDYVQLFKEKCADAIDMETAAFYQTCNAFGKPGLCIRSFSNPVTNSETEVLQKDLIAISSTNSSEFCFTLIHHFTLNKTAMPDKANDASVLIKKLQLEPHIEGGFFKRTHQSTKKVVASEGKYENPLKASGTSIYYLLESHDFSAWHRIKSDEVFNHHLGSSLNLHMLNPKSRQYSKVIIGNPLTENEAVPQFTVEAGTWFAASVNHPNSFCLVGCAVSPGFEDEDFELGDRALLCREFPEHKLLIEKYTRISQINENTCDSKSAYKIL